MNSLPNNYSGTSPTDLPVAVSEAVAARRESFESGRVFLEVLQERLGCENAEFTRRLGKTFGIETIDLSQMMSAASDFNRLSFAEAMRRQCVLFSKDDQPAILAISNPYDAALRNWAEQQFEEKTKIVLVHPLDLGAYFARQEEGLKAMAGALQDSKALVTGERIEELSLKTISQEDSSIVRLVNSTLYDALRAEASDIHLETAAGGLTIKYRLDGVLVNAGAVANMSTAEQAISRIKVMAELDIAERRVPQDGRFKVSSKGREIDFRVSIMPSVLGEDAVIRILDKQSLIEEARSLRLDHLGFNPSIVQQIRRVALEPHGMLLVTGPTGSGKTTTLYAAISEICNGSEKIITIEDPVEYELPGVLQIPVNEKKGLTFARGLRSILRHDPDRIMVGEIRDPETAEIAVQSALTGHLVFTTVHANNVFDVLGRFIHMGVNVFSFVAALKMVVAQRLVRVNCPRCRTTYTPDEAVLFESGLTRGVQGFEFRRGTGCAHCRGTGYKGRRAIAEILRVNDAMRTLISEGAPIQKLKEAARAQGVRFLREVMLDMVHNGETTLEEANRVTGIGE